MTDPEIRDITEAIRAEASSVKQCFTSYSFQALAIASTLLGACLGVMQTYPNAVYAPLPAIALLMAVARMGIFKYGTANRNHGYELHLARTSGLSYAWTQGRPRWRDEWRKLAWEEAVRAWRVVQPTLFRCIYRTPEGGAVSGWLERHHLGWINSFRPDLYSLTPQFRAVVEAFEAGSTQSSAYPWFLPATLARVASKGSSPPAVYYAGSYLQTMLALLAFVQLVLLLPLGLALFARPSVVKFVVFVAGVVLVSLRSYRIGRRRQILEDELLSIHSCAIVWQAVVMAHYMAVERTGGMYDHYTERLAEVAQDIARHSGSLHDWLSQGIPAGNSSPYPRLPLG